MKIIIKKRLSVAIASLMGTVFVHPNLLAQESPQDLEEKEPFEKIVVTANKREQSLRSIAGSVSALTGTQLKDMGAESLDDYIASLPGVHFNNYQAGASHVVIRGVATSTYHENGQDVVGYHLNGVPLSESGFPIAIPDIDTFDLDRVEVLRGPQGTLYGAGSLGGSVNYITKKADASEFNAALETSGARTKGAGENSYTFKGMLNIPLIDDQLAIRLTAGSRYVAGYLNNKIMDVDGSNDLKVDTTRMSLVYTPTDKTEITWLSLYQGIDSDDQTYAFVPGFERYGSRFPEYQNTEVTLHSLQLDQEFDGFNLTLVGAMAKKEGDLVFDYGQVGLLDSAFAKDKSLADADIEHYEARLTSTGDESFTWIIGTSYSTSDRHSVDGVYQEGISDYVDSNPDLFGGYSSDILTPNDFISRGNIFDQENKDFAIFGEIGYAFSDKLDLTVGGRYFKAKSTLQSSVGASITAANEFDPEGSQLAKVPYDESGFTPKISLKYQASDTIMIYSSYAEGFRVGGANPNPVSLTGIPGSESFDSDSTKNYEIGVRGDFLAKTLQLDATVFQIDWDDIQVRLFTPAPLFLAYTVNAAGAQNKGLEFSGAWHATSNLDIRANLTYLDAQISKDGGGFVKGATLPGSSKWAVSSNITYYMDDLRFSPRLSLDYRYASKAPESFDANRVESQGFHMLDLQANFTLSDHASVSVFIDNALDEYGILGSPFGHFFETPVASVVRPRTVGIKFNWEYY